jgi:hypothetical protein
MLYSGPNMLSASSFCGQKGFYVPTDPYARQDRTQMHTGALCAAMGGHAAVQCVSCALVLGNGGCLLCCGLDRFNNVGDDGK